MSSRSENVWPPGQRTIPSILVDALTANVAVAGFACAYQTLYLLPSATTDSAPSPWWQRVCSLADRLATRNSSPSALATLVLFAVTFHFLLDDWQCARDVDTRTPLWPAPAGRRFYLDVAIAGLFFAGFELVAKGDILLPLLFSAILLAGCAWSYAVFRATKRNAESIDKLSSEGTANQTAATVLGYLISHSIGATLFILAYIWLAPRGMLPGDRRIPEALAWTTIALYLVWDRLSKWIPRHLPGVIGWAKTTLGCLLYKLAKWLVRKAKPLMSRKGRA